MCHSYFYHWISQYFCHWLNSVGWRGLVWRMLCGKPRTGAVKGGGCCGEKREPVVSQPIARPLSQSFWEWGQQLRALSFLHLCWKREEESPSKCIPQVSNIWAVAKFSGCELFWFYSAFPRFSSYAKSASMLLVRPHSAFPKDALSLPFPHLQSFFGSMTILLGKH